MSDYQDPGTPTHEPLDMDAVWDLGELIDEACPDGKMTREKLGEIAEKQNVPLSHVYAAAAFDPDYEWQLESTQQVTICLGACQSWGACEITESLFKIRTERVGRGEEPFDVIAVGCLDRCTSPVAMDVEKPGGSTQHNLLRPGDETGLL